MALTKRGLDTDRRTNRHTDQKDKQTETPRNGVMAISGNGWRKAETETDKRKTDI